MVGLPQPPSAFSFEVWIGIPFLTWVEDSPVKGAVKVPGSRGTLAPLGGEVTLYRFGSHTGTGQGQTSPIGHSMST